MLTASDLLTLRADLIEHKQIHIDREHLRQVRAYLHAQGLEVELSPSVAGVRVSLQQ